jgi:DNA-binding NarL/FixJ family response regulator
MNASSPLVLSIVELGGYPNFAPLYERLGCRVVVENSMRKALAAVKQHAPDVVVAEFNFQSDFRDRTSSLESLMAVVQRLPKTRVIVFYEHEYAAQLAKLQANFALFRVMAYPIAEEQLTEYVRTALAG